MIFCGRRPTTALTGPDTLRLSSNSLPNVVLTSSTIFVITASSSLVSLLEYDIPLSIDLEIGDITAIVKLILDKYKPEVVLVRNESKVEENLDPGAETLARVALTEGYPVLLVWG